LEVGNDKLAENQSSGFGLILSQKHLMNIVSRNHNGAKVVMTADVGFLLLITPVWMLLFDNFFHFVIKRVIKALIELTIKFRINLGNAFMKD
jgi:hypothetical protein